MKNLNINKIYFPFDINTKIGGPRTFMKNLKTWFDKNNIQYCNDPLEAKAIFSPMFYNTQEILKLYEQGVSIILRLDGIYYETRHGNDYLNKNTFFTKTYPIASHVVFQSEYSKQQFFSQLGSISLDNYSVIYNGADTEFFKPNYQKKFEPDNIIFATTGNFRHIDMIEPIVLALDELYEVRQNFVLNVVGPISMGLEHYFVRPYIKHYGIYENSDIIEILNYTDIYIYTFLNPPCPNSVIEACACGIPVVGFSSGSMPELLFESKELLADVSKEIFQKYEQFNYKSLLCKITHLLNNYDYYKKLALLNSYKHSFDICATKYLQVFNTIKLK